MFCSVLFSLYVSFPKCLQDCYQFRFLLYIYIYRHLYFRRYYIYITTDYYGRGELEACKCQELITSGGMYSVYTINICYYLCGWNISAINLLLFNLLSYLYFFFLSISAHFNRTPFKQYIMFCIFKFSLMGLCISQISNSCGFIK